MSHNALVESLVGLLTLEEKIGLLSTSQSSVPRLNINEYHIGGEAAHGVVDRKGGNTTGFPLPLGLAQTWNPELLKSVGKVIGTEARIKYLESGKKSWLTLWAPTIDMERDPRWGRNEEAYGEDAYLTGKLSVGLIEGMQGHHEEYLLMAAAPKHFFGNNNEVGRESTSNFIPLRSQEEYYLKAFEPSITIANAQSLMTAYNGVNGIPCMQSPEILTTVKGKWGMDGFIVSDGGALTLNVDEYQYYNTYEEALADSLKSGIDCFVDNKELVESAAFKAIEKQLITEDDINQAVRNILKVRARLGHFTESCPYDQVDKNLLAGKEHAEIARLATLEQVVLLKNENNFLPLNKNTKLAISGPLGNVFLRDWYGGYPTKEKTIAESMIKTLGEELVTFHSSHDSIKIHVNGKEVGISMDGNLVLEKKGDFTLEDWGYNQFVIKDNSTEQYLALNDETKSFKLHKKEVFDWFIKELWIKGEEKWYSWNNKPIGRLENSIGISNNQQSIQFITQENGISEAVRLAQNASVNLVVLGNHPMINGKETQDRPGLSLPQKQEELLKAVYKVNPNVVLLVVGSYPFDLTWAQKHIPAILFTTHGSQELGDVMSDILFGECAPTGKLAQTWFMNEKALPPITNYDYIKYPRTYHYFDKEVLYPFGYGLTYGELAITNCVLENEELSENTPLSLRVVLKNNSNKEITDTVQVYGQLEAEEPIKLPKKLIGFQKLNLHPGEEKTVHFYLSAKEFEFYDVGVEKFRLPEGSGRIWVNFSSIEGKWTSIFKVNGSQSEGRMVSNQLNLHAFNDYEKAYSTVTNEKESCVELSPFGKLIYKKVEFREKEYILHYHTQEDGELIINNGNSKITYSAKERKILIPMNKGKQEDFILESTSKIQLITLKKGDI